jgi:hypothetical protein
MTGLQAVRHEFVDAIPENLVDGVVYVCITYATAVHLCCCGCKSQVVTPLSPSDWSVTFDGQSISLHPSIGNWSFPCQSHYWIHRNQIRWARRWRHDEIANSRRHATVAKQRQFESSAPERQAGTGQPERRAARPLRRIVRARRWLRHVLTDRE